MEPSLNKWTISVIIPVYNGGENFRKCLESLGATVPPPHEIIVIGDGDTDGSWKLAEEFGAQVLRIPVRRGPAHARNLGAKIARGDILFFIDADVSISPDAIGKIIDAFQRQSDLTALFGSYDDHPGVTNFLSLYKNLFHHYIHQTASEEASTFWGGCGAIRRDLFLSIGGFDERYREPSIEDIELGYRIKMGGYRIKLLKTLQGKHLKHWGMVSLLKSDFFHRALPWTQLILRDRNFINDLNLQTSSRISVLLTYGFLAALVGGYGWPGSFALASVLALLLLTINMPVYKFFLRKRGFWFMIQTIPWHWLYYFYSGLAFAIGVGRYLFSRGKSPKLRFSAAQNGLSDTPRHPE
jgi:glycosyltransferase involved in cell wall biosynthesis